MTDRVVEKFVLLGGRAHVKDKAVEKFVLLGGRAL